MSYFSRKTNVHLKDHTLSEGKGNKRKIYLKKERERASGRSLKNAHKFWLTYTIF